MSKSQSATMSHPKDESGTREIYAPQSWLWAGINAVMAVFFGLAALVQLNDPDPYIWVPIYAIPCLLCASIFRSCDAVDRSYWRVTAAIYMCFSVVGIVVLVVQVGQIQRKDGISNPLGLEEGRELLGLFIALGWTLMCWFSGHIMTTCSTGKLALLTGVVVLLGMMPLALWGTCYQSDFKHCNDML